MFTLQLLGEALQLFGELGNVLFQVVFRLPALGKLPLKPFSGSFGGNPGLFQFLFRLFVLGTCILQQFVDALQFLGAFCNGLFKSLFRLLMLGEFGFQLFNDCLKFQRAICGCLLQPEFYLIPLVTLALQLLGGALQLIGEVGNGLFQVAFCLPVPGKLSLKPFSRRFGGHTGLFQLLFGILAPCTFTLQQLVNGFKLCAIGCKFSLQLFNNRFSSQPILFQFFFDVFALCNFTLHLLNDSCRCYPGLFQFLCGICTLGLHLLSDTLQFPCALCNSPLQTFIVTEILLQQFALSDVP